MMSPKIMSEDGFKKREENSIEDYLLNNINLR